MSLRQPWEQGERGSLGRRAHLAGKQGEWQCASATAKQMNVMVQALQLVSESMGRQRRRRRRRRQRQVLGAASACMLSVLPRRRFLCGASRSAVSVCERASRWRRAAGLCGKFCVLRWVPRFVLRLCVKRKRRRMTAIQRSIMGQALLEACLSLRAFVTLRSRLQCHRAIPPCQQ